MRSLWKAALLLAPAVTSGSRLQPEENVHSSSRKSRIHTISPYCYEQTFRLDLEESDNAYRCADFGINDNTITPQTSANNQRLICLLQSEQSQEQLASFAAVDQVDGKVVPDPDSAIRCQRTAPPLRIAEIEGPVTVTCRHDCSKEGKTPEQRFLGSGLPVRYAASPPGACGPVSTTSPFLYSFDPLQTLGILAGFILVLAVATRKHCDAKLRIRRCNGTIPGTQGRRGDECLISGHCNRDCGEDQSTGDEKKTMLCSDYQDSRGSDEDDVSREIASFRAAADMVGDMIRAAEEGRAACVRDLQRETRTQAP